MPCRSFIGRCLYKVGVQGRLWVQRTSEVARFDGIILTSTHEDGALFREGMLASLELLKNTDARRFCRVRRHLAWICNRTLWSGGAAYFHGARTCDVDFNDALFAKHRDYYVTMYACMLVHEATHGVLRTRGVPYTPANRVRVERLCTKEEHRFLDHLRQVRPDLAQGISRPFDESDWHLAWTTTEWQKFMAVMRRLRKK